MMASKSPYEESKWFFARTIREFRKELGVSQDEFAKRVGISRDRLAQIEIGNGQMSDENLGKLVLEFPEIGVPLARRRRFELDRRLNLNEDSHEMATRSEVLRAIRLLEEQRKVLDELSLRLRKVSETADDPADV